MHVRTSVLFAAVASLLTVASTARAATIVFDGGHPDQQNIYFADSDYSWTAATNDVLPFSLVDSTITGADWWGGCVTNAGGDASAAETGTPAACSVAPDFTITIYDGEGSGTPGGVVATLNVSPVQTATGLFINGNVPEYHYAATFAPLFLPAGDYLFGLSATLSGATWGWETNQFAEAQHFQFNGSWQTLNKALAFDLVGPDATTTVPEPATMALLGTGLAMGAFRRRRAARVNIPR